MAPRPQSDSTVYAAAAAVAAAFAAAGAAVAMRFHLLEPTWSDLIVGVVSALLGWFTKWFVDRRGE